ncbi:MAG: exodeoxyribonuclease VII small subunit [Rothia mucilaginosa]|jgi:exodeoxyribonuclease VII, small subunit|uniref:exodeoxyribonuclease VII small subunit n=1 Tax=Rothia TaxID=32207 RepID=UPI0008A51DEF|nr:MULTISPECIES: exodeoxyribonuclease VII small subunit [Rothia]MBS5101467.1 exodeoxyribonuclease VII small subunit [Rothia mucilaginosa]OFR59389.1 exodeoxyribonuclease VII small subunit [Rothia sp. HMSC069C04]
MSENISFNSAELGAPVETLGYEQARAELEQVVRQLESGASDLETSIALWERGEALAARCEAWLQGAQERLNAARGVQAGAQAGQEPAAN